MLPALGPLEVGGADHAGHCLPVPARPPFRALSACRRAVPGFAAPLREVPLMLDAALGAREGARLAALPSPAPVLPVPGDAFLAAVPFSGGHQRRLPEDLHA